MKKRLWKYAVGLLGVLMCTNVLSQNVFAAEMIEEAVVQADTAQKTYRPSEDVFYELIYEVDDTGVVITGITGLEDEEISGELILPAKIDNKQVYKIGDNAFYDCDGLYGNVIIPEGVQQIGKNAFYDCDGFMGGVTTPSTLTIIGAYAFYDCGNMAGELVMAEGLKTIDDYAFYKCKKLRNGELPVSVIAIGDYAFYYCDPIIKKNYVGPWKYEIKFSSNLKRIGKGAFIYTNQDDVCFYITASTTKIGEDAFINYFDGSYCKHAKIYAPDLSYAQKYATDNGHWFCIENWEGRLLPEEVKLDNTSLVMEPWEIQTLTAQVLPDTTREKYKTVTWKSSDENIVTVEDGKLTAVGYGTATVTATSMNGISASCQVIVQDPTIFVERITLSETELTLYLWQEHQLTATIYPKDATDQTIEWSSSNEDIVTVKNGLVTAVDYGTATITASSPDGVSATCEVTVKKEFPFEDVDTNSWQYKGIDYVYQKGLMTGTSATTFAPNQKLTRTQFVVVLYSYAGKPTVSFSNRFSDVKNGQWYSNAVMWAVDNGITSGYANGKFGISDNITREQFVLMLYKYAVKSGKVTETPSGSLYNYADYNKVSSWAKEAMIWATQNGLMSGKPQANGTIKLDPQGSTTRAECAAIIMQYDMKF